MELIEEDQPSCCLPLVDHPLEELRGYPLVGPRISVAILVVVHLNFSLDRLDFPSLVEPVLSLEEVLLKVDPKVEPLLVVASVKLELKLKLMVAIY